MTTGIRAIASIHDPQRRALFDYIAAAPGPVSRDDAARELKLARGTAAFHLDRLVDDGVLLVEFKRLSGKTGPGSGRPSKLYRPASDELLASLPARHYDLAGGLLASSIEESARTGEPVRDALARVSHEKGRQIGAQSGSFDTALSDGGYEPRDTPGGGVILSNCPFHSLASSHSEVVCHANLNLLQGIAEGAHETEREVVFDPCEGQCCVRLETKQSAAPS